MEGTHWDRDRLWPVSKQRTREHLVPAILGGEKIIYACYYCNNLRQDRPLHEFLDDPIFKARHKLIGKFGRPMPRDILQRLYHRELTRIEDLKWSKNAKAGLKWKRATRVRKPPSRKQSNHRREND